MHDSRRFRLPWPLLLLVLVALSVTPGLAIQQRALADSPAALFAGSLTPENIDQRRVGGPDAIAGIGDWALGNGVLCAAIADPSHEIGITAAGGVLIDIGHCDRGDDHFGVLQPMLNLSRSQAVSAQHVHAEIDETEARIVTRAERDGLEIVTSYFVDHARPDRLGVRSEIQRVADGPRLFLFGDIVLHGNRQLSPFTISLAQPELSVGFEHPEIDMADFMLMARALVRADLHVLVTDPVAAPGIAYGWRSVRAEIVGADGERRSISSMGLNDVHFSMLAHLSRPPWLGDADGPPGLFELAQTAFMDLAPGETLVSEREIVISKTPDVASILSHHWAEGPRVHGRIDDPRSRIHVHDADGRPITFVVPDDSGRFAFRLPPGRSGPYEISIRTPDGRRLRRIIAASPEGVDLGQLELHPPAVVVLPSMGPVRLVFEGIAPTSDPVLGDDLLGFSMGPIRLPGVQARNHVSLAGSVGDPTRLILPSGRYRVYATRGPEFSVTETTLEVRPGSESTLEIPPLQRLAVLPGWVSADLHVHTAHSDDTSLPAEEQVRAFVASGADVLVSTDHDRAIDLAPVVDALGLSQRVVTLVGSELTSTAESEISPFTIGHANVFPIVPDRLAYREGVPDFENRRLRDVVGELRKRPERPLLQLNHPREGGVDGGNGAYLWHLGHVGHGHVPGETLDAPENRSLIEPDPATGARDLDFDAIELLNGNDLEAYARTRADWISWHLQGEARTATANSDSHDAASPIAMPRNYISYDGPLGEHFDEVAFMQSLRSGRSFGTTGPLLQLSLAGVGPGETFSGREAVLELSVISAPWVPVDSAFVYVNGKRVHRSRVVPGKPVKTVLHFERDSVVFVEVIGRASDSGIYRALLPGFTPFAFTNMIRVDADGDGVWTPPGLPDEPIPAVHRPALPRPLPRPPSDAAATNAATRPAT